MAEVADEQVLTALVERYLPELGYRIAHHDSPGLRGIDVAFVYRASVFDLHAAYTRAHTVVKRSPTRDRAEVLDRRNRKPYLYNCMWRLLDASHPGPFYFTGSGSPWFMFDHIIASAGLLRPEGGVRSVEDPVAIFRPDWLRRPNGAPKPFAMVGGQLMEGYSDHFRVVGQLVLT